MRSSLHLSDDTNQFGPGTDLIISLVAVLLMLSVVTSRLYGREKTRADQAIGDYNDAQKKLATDSAALDSLRKRGLESAGTFRVATESFPAGDFYARPVTRLV